MLNRNPYENDAIYAFPLDDSCRIVVSPLPFSHEVDEHRIEEVWQEGKKALGKKLFDGVIASLFSYHENLLQVQFIQYRVFYAWKNDPALRKLLPIHPIGISGVTRSQGRLLVGRRTLGLANRAGLIELVPSGSIDAESRSSKNPMEIDIQELMLRELSEESGIILNDPFSLSLKGLFWTARDGIWDIACYIDITKKDALALARSTDEYMELRWETHKELRDNIRKAPNAYVPLTRTLVATYSDA